MTAECHFNTLVQTPIFTDSSKALFLASPREKMKEKEALNMFLPLGRLEEKLRGQALNERVLGSPPGCVGFG